MVDYKIEHESSKKLEIHLIFGVKIEIEIELFVKFHSIFDNEL